MKKIIFGFSIFAFLLSCSKTNPNPSSIENGTMVTKSSDPFSIWYSENYHRLDEVTRAELLSFDDADLRRQIHSVLPRETTKNIWIDKYAEFREIYVLNNEQINFVNTIVEFLSSSDYSIPLNQNGEDFLESMYSLGSELFEKEMLYFALADIVNPEDLQSLSSGGSVTLNCNCASNSNWCGFISGPTNCITANPFFEQSGCGTLWAHYCNGRCGALPNK